MASLRDKMRQGLSKRVEESSSRASGPNRSFFKSGLNVNFWKVGEGQHLIDIVPYLAGPNDPNVPQGEPTYGLELYVHPSVGPGERTFICLQTTYDRPCPICEHKKQLIESGAPEEEWSPLKAKRRMVYNVLVYDTPQELQKGIQIWEVAWWFSERHFIKLAEVPMRDGTIKKISFADPWEGKSIAFERAGTGANNTQYLGHKFVDRAEPLPENILEKAHCLDELIHIPTYEEVYQAHWGKSVEEDNEEEGPYTVRESVEEGHPQAQSVTEEQIPPTRPSVGAKGLGEPMPHEQEEDVPFDNPPPQREVVEEGDATTSTQDVGQQTSEVEPPPQTTPSTVTCPMGGQFGVDVDQFDYCDSCPHWPECAEQG